MATRDACEQAVQTLMRRLDELDPTLLRRHAATRTVSCSVTDLDLAWAGVVGPDGLESLASLAQHEVPRTQIRLALSSDDLLALVNGSLTARTAWATGRLRVDASVRDLLRLSQLA